MKTAKLFFIGTSLLFLWIVTCTKPDYMNPLDKGGNNYNANNAQCAEDSDGDGTADMYDPDAPAACHRQSTPTLTLIGESVVVIPLNDSSGLPQRLLTMVNVSDSVYKDLSVADVVPVSNGYTSQCGPYTITYTVKNMANGIATAQRTVIVDCKGPTITLNGISPVDVDSGKPYSDLGATAYDSVDKEVKQVVTIGLPLNTSTVHEDSVIYTATDKVGNLTRAKRIVRIKPVIITDNDVPFITLIGSADTSMQIGVGSYSDPGAKAFDTTDGDISLKIVKTGSVNVAKVDDYTLTYKVSDNAGHEALPVSRMVHITQIDTGPDKTIPEIHLKGRNPDSVIVNQQWTEPGYWVSDNRDTVGLGDSVKVTGGPVDTKTERSFNLVYTVTDTAGNKSQTKGRTVVVYLPVADDKIPPKIKLDGPCGAKCTTDQGTKYTGGAIATDSAPGKSTIVITDKIVTVVKDSANTVIGFDVFYTKLGLYTITYNVSDAFGNKATEVSRTVFVKDTSPVPPEVMFAKYGVPLTDSLPTVTGVYSNSPFVADGRPKDVPTLTSIVNLRFTWNLRDKQINDFQFQLKNGNLDLRNLVTQTFASKTPKFTLTGSKITRLDGSYYITATAQKCVWVKTDGSFAITFK